MKASGVARYGLLICLALVLSYAESLLPEPGVPGVKLGLPNLVVIFTLYKLGPRSAWAVSLLRVALVSVLFGTGVSLAYSAAGAVLSMLVMLALRATGKFSALGVSVAGAVAHNAAQVLVAVALLGTGLIAYYLPVLCLSGTVAGVVIGAAAGTLVKRVRLPDEEKKE